ncbi:MAG: DUF3073 family protein [Nocardioidaceae bacterium]
MGRRGRYNAKQTKAARDLKYRSQETDFGALAKELHTEDDVDELDAKPDNDPTDAWADYTARRAD